jgi:hypothetical protein
MQLRISLFPVLALWAASASAAPISYSDFSSVAGLQLNGSAAQATDASNRAVLRVTPATYGQSGSVFSTSAVTLGADVSFSTRFQFNFNGQGLSGGADGLVFVVQTVSNTAGANGGGIGYQNLPHSVGVEFDNWYNGPFGDINANHVGIDLNGNIQSVMQNGNPGFALDSGQDLFAWIDYDGATDSLEVRLNDSASRPGVAILSYTVDLTGILGTPNAFVGFTSGTGAAYANQDVISWEFRDTYNPIDVPEPSDAPLFGAALFGVWVVRRRISSQTLMPAI